MSRPYRIVVQKVIEREITAADRAVLRLKVEPILSDEQTDELLARVAARNGWREVADGIWEKTGDEGETMRLDIARREVTTTIESEETVRQEVRRELRGDTWNWRQMREMTPDELAAVRQQEEERLEAALSDERVEQAREELQATVSQRLDAGAERRRDEVNRIVIEVVSEALKEKARELGNVEQVDEAWHGEEYELTISISE